MFTRLKGAFSGGAKPLGKLLLDIEDHTFGKFLPLIQSESEPRDGVLGERGTVAFF